MRTWEQLYGNDKEWNEDVPPPLYSAVLHLRNKFDTFESAAAIATQILCYAILHNMNHPHVAKRDLIGKYGIAVKKLALLAGDEAKHRFDEALVQMKPLTTVQAFFSLYIDALVARAQESFSEMLQIATANRTSIASPADWALSQMKMVVRGNNHLAEIWLWGACDNYMPDLDEKTKNDPTKGWGAPLFLHPMVVLPGEETSDEWARHESIMTDYVVGSYVQQRLIRLEYQLSQAKGEAALKLAQAQPNVTTQTAVPKSDKTNRRPAKNDKRRAVIRSVKDAGYTSIKYAQELDARGVKLSPRWIAEGCPSTYEKAYKAGDPWRKRIQDEKSKA